MSSRLLFPRERRSDGGIKVLVPAVVGLDAAAGAGLTPHNDRVAGAAAAEKTDAAQERAIGDAGGREVNWFVDKMW